MSDANQFDKGYTMGKAIVQDKYEELCVKYLDLAVKYSDMVDKYIALRNKYE